MNELEVTESCDFIVLPATQVKLAVAAGFQRAGLCSTWSG